MAVKSPITVLAEALQQTTSLKGHAQVLAGAAELARQGAPPRIVLVPNAGTFLPPAENTALADLTLTVAARLWTTSLDTGWELLVRLLQALTEQAEASGLWWQPLQAAWNTQPDTSRQGHELDVSFSVRLAVDRVAVPTGQVDAVAFYQE